VTSKTKDQIKAFFETGDRPSESQFIDFIDSYVDKSGPIGDIETIASAGTQGFAFVSAGDGKVKNATQALNFLGITVSTTAQVSAIATDALRDAFTTTAAASAAAVIAISSAIATTAQATAAAATTPPVLMTPQLSKQQFLNFLPMQFSNGYLHVMDTKAQGTAGGASTSTTTHIRVLNTVITNTITGASLASNQVTLPAGTYYFEGSAPCTNSNNTKLRLYNDTTAAYIFEGQNAYGPQAASGSNPSIRGYFTLAAQSAIELRHYITVGQATNGLGDAVNQGTEVYADIRFWKVA
jgi:hypothetical protein